MGEIEQRTVLYCTSLVNLLIADLLNNVSPNIISFADDTGLYSHSVPFAK